MSVVFCGVCPHPPIMVPQVGRGRDQEVANTQQAMLELGRRIKASGAQTLVMITPHGAVFADAIGISVFPELRGDLSQFNAPDVIFDLDNDLDLVQAIKKFTRQKGVPVVDVDSKLVARYRLDNYLDHGVTVPLYFIREAGVNLPLVHVSMGMLPLGELYTFGMAVQEAARDLGKPVAVIASGDLSHRLTKDAPAGYDPAGLVFDLKIKELLEQVDVPGFLHFDPELVEQAGQCGLRPIVMMLGTMDGREVQSEVLSYQGPFGVGYLVAALKPGAPAAHRHALAGPGPKNESFPVRVAREALTWHYDKNRKKKPFQPPQVPEEFAGRRAGAFVTLKKHGQLRGCIGTIAPVYGSLVEEIAANAVSAATRDTRFNPVTKEELDQLEISVDVLTTPQRVDSTSQLDPKKYGVIVSHRGRRGLLLPDLEGVDTVEQQVGIARQKAGIAPGEPVQLERFEVIRYE